MSSLFLRCLPTSIAAFLYSFFPLSLSSDRSRDKENGPYSQSPSPRRRQPRENPTSDEDSEHHHLCPRKSSKALTTPGSSFSPRSPDDADRSGHRSRRRRSDSITSREMSPAWGNGERAKGSRAETAAAASAANNTVTEQQSRKTNKVSKGSLDTQAEEDGVDVDSNRKPRKPEGGGSSGVGGGASSAETTPITPPLASSMAADAAVALSSSPPLNGAEESGSSSRSRQKEELEETEPVGVTLQQRKDAKWRALSLDTEEEGVGDEQAFRGSSPGLPSPRNKASAREKGSPRMKSVDGGGGRSPDKPRKIRHPEAIGDGSGALLRNEGSREGGGREGAAAADVSAGGSRKGGERRRKMSVDSSRSRSRERKMSVEGTPAYSPRSSGKGQSSSSRADRAMESANGVTPSKKKKKKKLKELSDRLDDNGESADGGDREGAGIARKSMVKKKKEIREEEWSMSPMRVGGDADNAVSSSPATKTKKKMQKEKVTARGLDSIDQGSGGASSSSRGKPAGGSGSGFWANFDVDDDDDFDLFETKKKKKKKKRRVDDTEDASASVSSPLHANGFLNSAASRDNKRTGGVAKEDDVGAGGEKKVAEGAGVVKEVKLTAEQEDLMKSLRKYLRENHVK